MIHSLSVRFYLNSQKKRGDKMPVYMRITLNRKKAEIAMKYFLEQKEWNEGNQRTKKNTTINQNLSEEENKVYDIVKQLDKDKKQLSPTIIKNYLLNKDKFNAPLLEFYESYIARIVVAAELEKESIQRYRDTKEHLKNFLEKKKFVDFLLENVDYKFLSDFDMYLIAQKVNKGEGIEKLMARNTVNKHHNRLRTILIRAMKEGQIAKNPYWDFKLKSTPTNRAFLTEEELKKITDCKSSA